MIDERMEEQASLYALGVLEGEEKLAFEAAMHRDAELQQLVAALSASNAALAGTVPLVDPPSSLKNKILDRIDQMSQTDQFERILPLPFPQSSKPQVIWLPWALAACLTILCVALAAHDYSMRNRVQDLSELSETLQSDTNHLQTTVAALEETNRATNVRIAELNQLAQTLQDTTNDLQRTIASLQETNRLANVRIAMLGSLLSDQPKAVAVSLWDNKNQNGVFVVQNLKPVPSDKDYQLWVIDPQYKTPVDAGVFQVDAQGNVRFQFKPSLHITDANKFAVTEEAKGGSPVPKGQMVLLGS
jgi:anti-sigma-K factor RskA